MKMVSARTLDVASISEDLAGVIVASGYETRARFVAEHLGAMGRRRVAIGFDEHADKGARATNDIVLTALGYAGVRAAAADGATASSVLREMINAQTSDQHVLIDISSMTRAWCGSIVRTLLAMPPGRCVTTIFAYAPAEALVQEPLPYPPNEVASPVAGFSGLGLPDKPGALLVGLGMDPGRALGILDLVDPAEAFAFYTAPEQDGEYERTLLAANGELLRMTRPDCVIKYPLRAPHVALALLDSVCGMLRRDYRLVLTSFGPKLFALECFLIAGKYPDVSVWRVSAGTKELPKDRRAEGSMVILAVEWA